MKRNNGVVFLIGAGPGDPELITVKGKRMLERCDTVVYDALVNEQLIARLPETVHRIFVGKRGGIPSPKQEEINRILVREAKQGKAVARLKGGDPLVFGRGSEEMEYLSANKIRYEVVPGITSAIAAPTCAGIPVTHRSVSRSFAVATGHLQEGEAVDALRLPEADTVIFLMAMENLPVIVGKLLNHGRFTKKTPAALVRNGTLPDQETITGTLGTIAALKEKHHIKPPAVFIVGETVRYVKALQWQNKMPLAGIRVAVLRTNEQSGELTEGLSALGATVLSCPLINIEPRKDSLKKINAAFLRKFSMVIFTSPNGAGIFMEKLMQQGHDVRSLAHAALYAMGSGTAAVLRKYCVVVDALPEKFVAEGLLKILPTDLSKEKILIPRAAAAREVLPETLIKRGAYVTVLPVYDTVKIKKVDYTFNDGDYILFTSSSIVDIFYSDPQRSKCAIHPVCIGDITAATVRRYFTGQIAVAVNATIPALIDALEQEVYKNRKKR